MFRGVADFFGGGDPYGGEDGIPMGRFRSQYRCYSVAMYGGNYREDVDNGGKIIMPPSALDQLTRRHVVYPMLFKMTNQRVNRESHCGVLEFVAEEGKIYIPHWMMDNLYIREGDMVWLENVSLPSATFAKFQPQSVDFLEITNPKALLERSLRSFACLTKGDTIAIPYNKKVYEFCVLEVLPGKAVSIIECDMKVDFAPPVGYKVPETPESMDENDLFPFPSVVSDGAGPSSSGEAFKVFQGEGKRLDGKKKNLTAPKDAAVTKQRGIPNYNYQVGRLNFVRAKDLKTLFNSSAEDQEEKFEAFTGKGQALKEKRKKK